MAIWNVADRAKLHRQIADAADAMAQACLERLQEYEAEHGTITPAPRGTKFKARSSEAQQMAATKRILITNGWLKEDGETPESVQKCPIFSHEHAMAELTKKIENLSRAAIHTRRVVGQADTVTVKTPRPTSKP